MENLLRPTRTKRFFFVVLFFILCLSSSWYALFLIKQQGRQDVQEHLEQVMAITHSSIHNWIEHRIGGGALIADRPDIQHLTQELLSLSPTPEVLLGSDALQKLRSLVQPWLVRHQDLDILIVSPDNVNIASMQDALVGSEIFHGPRKEQFSAVLQGVSQLILPLHSEADSPEERARRGEALLVAVPVYDVDAKVIAGLVIHVDPGRSFSSIIQIARSGASGDAYAMDQQGILLSRTRFGADLQELGLLEQGESTSLHLSLRDPGGNMIEGFRPASARHELPYTLAAKRLMAGEKGYNVSGYRDYRGVEVVGTWAWFGHNKFGLIYELDFVEAYASYIFIRRTVLIALLLIAILFSTFFVLTSRRQREAVALQRKLAFETKAQLESEQKYVRLVNSLRDKYFFYSYDTDGVIRTISPGVKDILGYTPQDLAENWGDYLTDNPIKQKIEGGTRDALQGEQVTPYRVELYRLDGSLCQLEVIKVPILGEDGNVISVEGMAHDITEQLIAEEALRSSTLRLMEAQRIGHIGSWQWDSSTGNLLWSDEVFKIFGRSRSDFSLNYDSFFNCIHPDDRKELQERVDHALVNGKPYDINHRIVLPDGSERIVCEQGEILFDKNGQVRGMQGTVQNITEQKRIAAELEQYRQGLEELVTQRTTSLNAEIDERKKVEALLNIRLEELGRFSKLATGREIRMVELKEEINSLLAAQGQKSRYTIVS